MSEETTNPESSNKPSENEHPAAAGGGGSMRKLLLLIALLVVLGLFAYDQFVTKSAFNEALKNLDEMQTRLETDAGFTMQGDHDGDGFITTADLKKTAGRDPAATEEFDDRFMIETYSWPRIIPGMTYDIFAVYRKGNERNVFYKVMTERPDASSLPAATKVGEPGSVSTPVIGGLPPERPDRNKKQENGDDQPKDGASKSGDDDKASDDGATKASDEDPDKKSKDGEAQP